MSRNNSLASSYDSILVCADNGQQLQGEPTQKGIFINNGKKVVIK